MSDSVQKFYLDQESFGEQELRSKEIKTEEYSQDVINIRELFRLLSVEDRILVKRIIAEEKIFQCKREKISAKYLFSKKISVIFAKEIKNNNHGNKF